MSDPYENCEHFILEDREKCPVPGCGYIENVTVNCDERCMALLNPNSAADRALMKRHRDELEETRASLEHWRRHDRLLGCSHGR